MLQPTVADAMSPSPVTCTPFEALAGATRRLLDRELGCLPVVAGDGSGRLLGMLTPVDVVYGALRDGGSLDEIQVRQVMGPVATCRAEQGLDAVLARMQEEHVRRLAAVDEKGRLLGVITCGDVAAALRDCDAGSEEGDLALCRTVERAGRRVGRGGASREWASARLEAA